MCIGRTIFIFVLALVGVFYPYNRGALFTALVVIYALTAGIAGYTAASFFCQLEGTNWVSGFLIPILLPWHVSFPGMSLTLVIAVFFFFLRLMSSHSISLHYNVSLECVCFGINVL